MRVAVVTTQQPFVRGGAELLAEQLTQELSERGHPAELVQIPSRSDSPRAVLRSMTAARLLRIGECDRVIALKWPAFYVRHDDKVVWLLHQFRQAYELWNTPFGLPSTPEYRAVRRAVAAADNAYLAEARQIYTNSRVTSHRLQRYNGFASDVLYPPLVQAGGFRSGPHGDYVFYPSRINGVKRQALAIEAMRFVASGVRLVVAGSPDEPAMLAQLRAQISEHDLDERVDLIGRWVTHDEKTSLMANALACLYIPVDEDSYGFVSLEAYASEKPVITCTDSGGTLDLVSHDRNGLVVPPRAEALAGAFDALHLDRDRARRLGAAGPASVAELELSWDHVVAELTR